MTTLAGVGGFAGVGAFSGQFLWNGTGGVQLGVAGSPSVLTLTNLPSHTSIDLNFLLAVIDTWDGNNSATSPIPAFPDQFNVTVDGVPILVTTFEHAENRPDFQDYVPPAGVELARYRQLYGRGFPGSDAGSDVDSAYDLGRDPRFDNILHTASSLRVEWFADGAGWQGNESVRGLDESWAIDNVEVLLNGVPDINMLSAQFQAGNTVQFTYETTGNPGQFQVGLYRSANGVSYDSAAPIATASITPPPVGGTAAGTIALPSPWIPDTSKPFLVVVADPPSAGKPKGEIIESNDTDQANHNNAASFALPKVIVEILPVGTPTMGQDYTLRVRVVNNTNSETEVRIEVQEHYVSDLKWMPASSGSVTTANVKVSPGQDAVRLLGPYNHSWEWLPAKPPTLPEPVVEELKKAVLDGGIELFERLLEYVGNKRATFGLLKNLANIPRLGELLGFLIQTVFIHKDATNLVEQSRPIAQLQYDVRVTGLDGTTFHSSQIPVTIRVDPVQVTHLSRHLVYFAMSELLSGTGLPFTDGIGLGDALRLLAEQEYRLARRIR